MADKQRFEGRVAVVTGGASGIGFGAAQRLLREGAKVAVWDRDAAALAALAEKIGGPVHTETLDITDWSAVERAAAYTFATLGRIDILVASAGITGPNPPLWEYPIDAWKQVLDVNVNGLFYSNRAVVPFMLKNDYGRIVNIASVAGKEGNPNMSAYSTSKAAVIGLTKSLGKELATTGVLVNCLTPAAAKTDLFDQMTQAQIDYMLAKIPMNRFVTVEEIAAMVAWLASEECSFSTGAVFDISGGRAVY